MTSDGSKISGDNILQNQYNLIDDHEETIKELKANINDYNPMMTCYENSIPYLSNDIQKLINKRFDKIEENIDHLISQKIAENTTVAQVEKIEAKLNEAVDNNNSYGNTLKKNLENTNLVNIIKDTKNDDLIQEKERELRSTNIIYGINEATENEVLLKEQDEKLISSFLENLGITSLPKEITRLGKPGNDKKQRPIKVKMTNAAEKDKVMSRLSYNLKDAEEIYRKVSVRDDYTIEEREQIREWVKKTVRKNKDENTDAWNLRSTPKNGLRLVKIAKER